MLLEENIEHETVLIYRSPKPVPDTIDARTDLIEMPPGPSTGFPVTQVFSEEGAELDTPLAQCFVTDLEAALVEQFLDVSVTDGEAMVWPDGVLNDADRITMAVEFRVSHSKSAYPDPVKPTKLHGQFRRGPH